MPDQQGITTAEARINNEPNAQAENTATSGPAVEINDNAQAAQTDASGAMQDADIARANGVDPAQMVAATTTTEIPNPTSSPANEPAQDVSTKRSPSAQQPELGESLRPLEGTGGVADGETREVSDGRSYEIIYIVNPTDQNAPQATATRARDLIEGQGGAIDNVRTSEVRRLAYQIAKQQEGVYVVINCRVTQTIVPELDRFFKLEEAVLRHMIVKD